MKFNKDDLYSLLGSVGFHLLILLVLSLTILSTVVPEEDSGVLVNFGNVDEAAGTFEPLNTGQEPMEETTPPPPPTPAVETAKEELVTQDVEESVALAEAKKKKEEQRKKEEAIKREQDRIQKEKLEQQRLADAQRQKELAIKNKVAGAFGAGSAAGGGLGGARCAIDLHMLSLQTRMNRPVSPAGIDADRNIDATGPGGISSSASIIAASAADRFVWDGSRPISKLICASPIPAARNSASN